MPKYELGIGLDVSIKADSVEEAYERVTREWAHDQVGEAIWKAERCDGGYEDVVVYESSRIRDPEEVV